MPLLDDRSPQPPPNPFASKKKRGAPPRPQKTLSLLLDPGLLRGFALGAMAIGACLYALVRAYTHKPPSMVHAPQALDAASPAPSPSELPAPDLELEPAPTPTRR